MQIGLILIALAFPLLELAVLIKVGQSIGFWKTVLLLAAIGVAGGYIIHRQGLAATQRALEAAREGRPPIEPVADSMLLMLAGTLLLIPGLITDVAGLLLLVPLFRRAFARWTMRRMFGPIEDGPGAYRSGESPFDRQWHGRADGRSRGEGVVIEGEWERVEDPKPDSRAEAGPGTSKPGRETPRS